MKKYRKMDYCIWGILLVIGTLFGIFLNRVYTEPTAFLEFFSNTTARGILDWVYEIAMIISLISILIMFRQFKGEHEKGRREKAIELLLRWNDSITADTNRIKEFCEQLSDEQCRKLARYETFEISAKKHAELKQLLSDDNVNKCHEEDQAEEKKTSANKESVTGITVNKNKEKLTSLEIKQLRYQVVRYLNLLEIIMTAWKDNVADNEMIENEFSFLLSETEGKTLLENMRKALGNECYPSISIFCANMKQKQQKKLTAKKEKI